MTAAHDIVAALALECTCKGTQTPRKQAKGRFMVTALTMGPGSKAWNSRRLFSLPLSHDDKLPVVRHLVYAPALKYTCKLMSCSDEAGRADGQPPSGGPTLGPLDRAGSTWG